jgi:hypothetical protein
MELSMGLHDVKIDSSAMLKKCQDMLQVAAMRGREEMVERLPARGQTPYSTGRLRESVRFEQTGPLEYMYYVQQSYGIYLEFGTGPKGQATGAVPEFPNDPQPSIAYNGGEVLVTRWRGRLLTIPIVRHTMGMEAQPYVRPALVMAMDLLRKLLSEAK